MSVPATIDLNADLRARFGIWQLGDLDVAGFGRRFADVKAFR